MSVRWIKMIDSLSAAEGAVSDGFVGVQAPLGLLESLTQKEMRREKERLEKLDLTIDVCTTPLPPGVAVTQRGFNIYVWTEYVKKAVRCAADFGCKTIAWSDGRARLFPLEGDTSGAKQQVLEFLAMLCDVSGRYGISVLVEPLGPRRTNFLNRMQDVAEFIPLLGKDNLSSMISLRELAEIDLKESELQTYSHLIALVQMENPLAGLEARESPRADDGYDYLPFLKTLRRIGYDGTITLPQDADNENLSYCENLWAEAE
jgi:sugar phosphate isomerase/epimerase